MIRNIITATVLLAALVSMASIMQLAHAVEPELNFEISAYKDNLAEADASHPFAWTPDLSLQNRVIKLYESLIVPKSIRPSGVIDYGTDTNQQLFSFEIYQGDGLDDLRQQSKHHNRITLPDEDTEAYGVTVKQRF